MDACQWTFPLCPAQAGYSAQFDEGIISAKLDGGPPFMRLDIPGNPVNVSATWVLSGDHYCVFQGLYRDWARTGGDPFYIDLILESASPSTYEATFVPGSVRLASKSGDVYTVNAQLLAMPKFLDPCEDFCASAAILYAYYGPATCRVLQTVARTIEGQRT